MYSSFKTFQKIIELLMWNYRGKIQERVDYLVRWKDMVWMVVKQVLQTFCRFV